MGDGVVRRRSGRNERGGAGAEGILGPVFLAVSLPARLRGLLLRAPRDGVTVLAPCRDVHTLGMTRAIDVAFADDRGRVIRAFRDVGPGRRLRCPGAAVALERFAADGPWLRPGDQMEIAVASAAAREEER